MIQAEERQNQQLLDLSARILDLTTQVHALITDMNNQTVRRTGP
jgi:hypothetical protein